MTASIPGGLSGAATGAGPHSIGSPEPSEAGLERTIARLLTGGTYASIACLAVGLGLMLATGIGPLSGGPTFDLGGLVEDLAALRPDGFLWVGLILVIGTPAARVATSLVGFARAGERPMVVVAGLILVVIAVSVGLAKGLEG
ncbi:MAG: hypothetical protein QOF49_1026 [Chloroflexota bacterium]|jgi:uncharacterized membrane protein|nr:hypothetical protein [Chloroflexota bacterium]